MEIQEVTFDEFSQLFPSPYHIFGSGEFAKMNREKAEQVYCLVFKDPKYRLGLTGGLRRNGFFTPFSAPHGGFVYLKEDMKIQHLDEAIDLLIDWCKTKKMECISFTLPPDLYSPNFLAKQVNSLFRHGFYIKDMELNHSFNLDNFNENYLSFIWHNARKNLKKALNNNLTFRLCETTEELETAYEIIQINRRERGFPLNMTLSEVKKTIGLIPADVFLTLNEENAPIASAIVFHVAKDTVQVIYWGDLPQYNALKTMNFLTYRVFEYYKNQGIRIVDIGQSTVDSIPNHGLCDFKESIGCDVSEKRTYRIELN